MQPINIIKDDQPYQKPPFIDDWVPEIESDIIFRNVKRYFIAPVSSFWKTEQSVGLDMFDLATKKCYNSQEMREHMCHYLNYFEKFYDKDKEYLTILCRIKFMIGYGNGYNKNSFIYDIRRYILSETLISKVTLMVEDNYRLTLNYKSINNPALQYTDQHAKMLMLMSMLMNMCIPMLTHFAYVNKITDIDSFLLEIYDYIIYIDPSVDIYSKMYETCITNVSKNEQRNKGLWMKQDIRGLDTVIHSDNSLDNIVLNIMPKYTFRQNVINFNFTSINNNTGFQVIDIEYEFSYIPLSSSKRDEDSTSEFDKFEATLTKQNEQIYLQNKVNCFGTNEVIDSVYGPFDNNEVNFYLHELSDDSGNCINGFQKQLIFNIFYKYFGDSSSINAINKVDYIKLMIAARKILQSQYMIVLPYIVSSKVEKLVGRKTVNKKEMTKLESSKYYPMVVKKYQNEKIIRQILSTIATIISSDFRIVDFKDLSLNGRLIETVPDMIIEEYLMYTLLI
jgi:hypothetical protein